MTSWTRGPSTKRTQVRPRSVWSVGLIVALNAMFSLGCERRRMSLDDASADKKGVARSADKWGPLRATPIGDSVAVQFASSSGGVPARILFRSSGLSTETGPFKAGPGPGFTSQGAGFERVVSDGIHERWQTKDDGLEQSWIIEKRREHAGDLVLHVHVAGATKLLRDRVGILLGLASPDAPRVRYSQAVLIDAAGQRAPLETTVVDSEIQIRLPRAALAQARYPILVDPTISIEQSTTLPSYSRAYAFYWGTVIGYDGANFIYAWPSYSDSVAPGHSIVVGRVGLDGTLLDPGGFPIADALFPWMITGTCHLNHCLVAWYEGNSPPLPPNTIALLDTASPGLLPKIISLPETNSGQVLQVVAGATEFLLAWSDIGSFNVRRIAFDGTPLGTSSTVVDQVTGSPRLAFGGGTYLVAWGDGSNVMARTIAPDLTLGTPFAITSQDPPQAPSSLAGDSSGFLVTWDARPAGMPVFRGALVSPLGTTSLLPALRPDLDGQPVRAAASSDGSQFWLMSGTQAVSPPATVKVVAINDAGNLSAERSLADARVEPAGMSCSTSTCLATWGLDGALVGSTLPTPNPVRPLGVGTTLQRNVAVAFDGATYLAAWAEESTGGLRMKAARLDFGGASLDPSGVDVSELITHPVWNMYPSQAFVAASPSGFLVSWGGPTDNGLDAGIFARVLGVDGQPANGAQLIGTIPYNSPSAVAGGAFDGNAFRLIWNGAVGTETRLMSQAGTLTGTSSFAGSQQDYIFPRVVSPAGRVLYVRNGTYGLRGWVTALDGGAVAGPFTIDAFLPSSAFTVLSASDHDFMVVYGDQAAYAQRVSLDGELIGPRVVLDDWSAAGSPPGLVVEAAAFDGADHVLVWRTPRTHDQLLARRLNADASLHGDTLVVDADARKITTPVAVRGPEGTTMVAYTRFDQSPPYGSDRVRTHLLWYERPLGRPCLAGSSCESGMCVDGVCCDTLCGDGAVDDCLACSVAAGAPNDGECALLGGSHVCRSAADDCDAPEVCSGANACPIDDRAADGVVCAAGVCQGGACTFVADLATSDADAAANLDADLSGDGGTGASRDAGTVLELGDRGCSCDFARTRRAPPNALAFGLFVFCLLHRARRRRTAR